VDGNGETGSAVAAFRQARSRPSAERVTHAYRAAQSGHEVEVAEDEHDERNNNSDDKVDPLVGGVEERVLHEPTVRFKVHRPAFRAVDAGDLPPEVARHVGDSAGGEDADDGGQGECAADETSGVQWVTDSNVPAYCHGNDHPRARQDKRVDDATSVGLVNYEVEAGEEERPQPSVDTE